MKKTLFLALLLPAFGVQAQVAVNTTGAAPDPSAILDASSSSKGILAPRMTAAQRLGIAAPAKGLLVYQTDATAGSYYNEGSAGTPVWKHLSAVPAGDSGHTLYWNGSSWTASSNIFNTGGNVGIGTDTPGEKLDVNGSVRVATGHDFKFDAPRTRYLSIPCTAFNLGSEVATSTARLAIASSGTWVFVHGGDPNAQAKLFAPVLLPHGATLEKIEVTFWDQSTRFNGRFELMAYNPATSSGYAVSLIVSSSGTPGQVTLSSPLSAVVDTEKYTYFLTFTTAEATDEILLGGARISYTVSKAD